ncbi:hypothetical protein JW948_11615, partial [bacterium]|nr:hypothetical protein [bacterium]
MKSSYAFSIVFSVIIKRIFLFCMFTTLTALSAYDLFNEYQLQPEVWHPVQPEFSEVDAKGDLNLRIPVLTVPGRNLDFPVVFNYSSSVTVFQNSSWIGSGWSWDPGSVTRSVNGFSISPGNEVQGIDFPDDNVQTALDVYYVHLNNQSVQFYKSNAGTVMNITPQNEYYPNIWKQWKIEFGDLNYQTFPDLSQPRKIELLNEPVHMRDFGKVVITINDGTRYIFRVPTLSSFQNFKAVGGGFDIGGVYDNRYISTWRLEAILGPDYDDGNGNYLIPSNDRPGAWIRLEYAYDSTHLYYLNQDPFLQLTYLSKIVTPTHEARFITELRGDLDLTLPGGTAVHKRLRRIELYNKKDMSHSIQSVELEFDPVSGIVEQSYLKRLTIMDKSGSLSGEYGFDYFPVTKSVSSAKMAYDYDEFGFLNYDGITGYDYSSGATAKKNGLLKTISYPSGGYEEIIYESDVIDILNSNNIISYTAYNWSEGSIGNLTYTPGLNRKYQGGQRVSQIVQYDAMGGSIATDYSYPTDGFLTGVPPFYYARQGNLDLNLSYGLRGQSSVYYPFLKITYADNSYQVKVFSIASPNTIIKSALVGAANSYLSVLQSNNDVAWGQLTEKKYYQDNNLLTRHEKFLYAQNTLKPMANSSYLDVMDLPLCTFFQILEKQEIIDFDMNYPGNTFTATTEYDYTHDFQIRRRYMYNSNADEAKAEETTYAHECYDALKTRNILTPVSKSDIYSIHLTGPTDNKIIDGVPHSIHVAKISNPANPNPVYSAIFNVNLITVSQITGTINRESSKDNVYITLEKRLSGTYDYIFVESWWREELLPDEVTLEPGYDYRLKAVAVPFLTDGEVGCGATLSYIEEIRSYYASNAMVWRLESNIVNAFYKPDATYRWAASEPVPTCPVFSYWDPSTTPPEGSDWRLQRDFTDYDRHGNLIDVADAHGAHTTFQYDPVYGHYLETVAKGGMEIEFMYHTYWQLPEKTIDENDVETNFVYDEEGRLSQVINHDGHLVSSNEYYLSKTENGGVFDPAQPNFVRTTKYPQESWSANLNFQDSPLNHGWQIYEGSGSLSMVWDANENKYVLRAQTTASPSTGFGVVYPGAQNLDLRASRLDLKIKDINSFWFYVKVKLTDESEIYLLYIPGSGIDRVENGYAYIYIGTSYIDGYWHVIDRNLVADLARFGLQFESIRWFCIRGDYDLSYIRLHENPGTTCVYYDGIGRDIQTQSYEGDIVVVSLKVYNEMGSLASELIPRRHANPDRHYLEYDEVNNPDCKWMNYLYYKDGLNRLSRKLLSDGWMDIKYQYGVSSIPVVDYNGLYPFQKIEEKKTSGNYIHTMVYKDDRGNDICKASGDAGAVKYSSTLYDISDNPVEIHPPNYHTHPSGSVSTDWIISHGYNTLGQMTHKCTPDEGTIWYVYDKKGNTKFVQTADQRTNGRYTVHNFDSFDRTLSVGEELDDTWLVESDPPDISNTTLGTEPDEWKYKYFYDSDYLSTVPNYCMGRLSKMLINDGSSTSSVIRLVYDNQGNIIQKNISGSFPEKDLKQAFDHIGRPVQLTYPSGHTILQSYDQLGRIQSLYSIGDISSLQVPPTNPTGFSAALTGSRGVNLSWIYGTDEISGFYIERKSEYGDFLKIAEVSASARSYNLLSCSPGETYGFRIMAFKGNTCSNPSNISEVRIPDDPNGKVLYVTFNQDHDDFQYEDAVFGGNGYWANGIYSTTLGYYNTGAVLVRLGDSNTGGDETSGAWQRLFYVPFSGNYKASVRCRLKISPAYEPDEFGNAILTIDGVRYGNTPDGELIRLTGGGGTDSNWQLFVLAGIPLSGGIHQIAIGGYNNQSNDSDEWVEVHFDELTVETDSGSPPPPEPPATPTGLSATTVSCSEIGLVWNDVSDESGYKIERKVSGG